MLLKTSHQSKHSILAGKGGNVREYRRGKEMEERRQMITIYSKKFYLNFKGLLTSHNTECYVPIVYVVLISSCLRPLR